MYVVKSDRLALFPPTLHPEVEEVTIGDQRFEMVDPAIMWRRQRARCRTMQEYAHHGHGLIFLVDACDPERFAEAKRDLDVRLIFPTQFYALSSIRSLTPMCGNLLSRS
jgi:GTP-binding protein SAR1